MYAPEMISSAYEAVFTGLIEVHLEFGIEARAALRRLDDDELDGEAVDPGLRPHVVPMDVALVMGDVDAMDLIAVRIFGVAVERAPAEPCRGDEKEIEDPDVAYDDEQPTEHPGPSGAMLQERQMEKSNCMRGASCAPPCPTFSHLLC